MTRRPDGTVVYTPFPNYEKEVTDGGAVTERATYTIAGQMVAIRSAGVLYYTYTDHLGNVVLLSKTNGSIVSGSNARYDPFGNYRTWPGSNVNPLISDRGFTGHIHDNTGDYPTQNVGLIYMNARYYLPEVGRFISPDTIVPEPGEPQSYNRYTYTLNNPINLTDPSGHRPTSGCGEVEAGCTLADELDPDQTYIDNNGSPVWADPNLVERYPGRPLGEIAAWTGVGLIGVAAAPIVLEATTAAALPAAPVAASGGTAACADGDCTNELSYFARAGEFGIRSFRELRAAIQGTGLQAHHIIEQRLAPTLGAAPHEMLSVALTPEEHQAFTNAWRGLVGYVNSSNPINTVTATVDDIWNAAQNIYQSYPALLEAARQTIFGN